MSLATAVSAKGGADMTWDAMNEMHVHKHADVINMVQNSWCIPMALTERGDKALNESTRQRCKHRSTTTGGEWDALCSMTAVFFVSDLFSMAPPKTGQATETQKQAAKASKRNSKPTMSSGCGQ